MIRRLLQGVQRVCRHAFTLRPIVPVQHDSHGRHLFDEEPPHIRVRLDAGRARLASVFLSWATMPAAVLLLAGVAGGDNTAASAVLTAVLCVGWWMNRVRRHMVWVSERGIETTRYPGSIIPWSQVAYCAAARSCVQHIGFRNGLPDVYFQARPSALADYESIRIIAERYGSARHNAG